MAKEEGEFREFEDPKRSKNVNGFEFLDDQSREEKQIPLQADDQPFNPIIFNPFLSEKKELKNQERENRPEFEKPKNQNVSYPHYFAKNNRNMKGKMTGRAHRGRMMNTKQKKNKTQNEEDQKKEEEKGVNQDLEDLMLD